MARESKLSKAVSDILQILQNSGKILWHDRLQSGEVVVKKGNHCYKVKLCKSGTPDRYAILRDGRILWLEIKVLGKKLEPLQEEFRDRVIEFDMHEHLTIRSIHDLMRFFNMI